MGSKRVTPQEIIEMRRLYKEKGTYVAVGREVGRSGSTVAKYVKMQGIPQNIKLIIEQVLANEN